MGSGRREPPSPPHDCRLGKRGAGIAGAADGLSGSGAAVWSQDWAGARCSKACSQIRERRHRGYCAEACSQLPLTSR
ncbi:unnamed protein product [Urochloa humidicola]